MLLLRSSLRTVLLRLLNGINQARGHITRGATVEMQFNDGTDASRSLSLFSSLLFSFHLLVIFSLSVVFFPCFVCSSLLFRSWGESCQHSDRFVHFFVAPERENILRKKYVHGSVWIEVGCFCSTAPISDAQLVSVYFVSASSSPLHLC